MHDVSDGPRVSSKWTSQSATLSTNQEDNGKENRIPSSGRDWRHFNITTRRNTPTLLLEDELLPPSLNFEASTSSSLLGKRSNRTETSTASQKHFCALNDDQESQYHQEQDRRDAQAMENAVTHFEARALELHGSALGLELEEEEEEEKSVGSDGVTMFIDDCNHVGQLYFGAVPLDERKHRQLILKNASELGNARVKYEGYVMVQDGNSPLTKAAKIKTRFKCDLHVCVVDALKSVTLRVTFEPLPMDIGHQVTAVLKFTVNNRFKLQCRATGTVIPRVPQMSRLGRMRQSKQVDAVVVRAGMKQNLSPRVSTVNIRQMTSRSSSETKSTAFSISSALALSDLEAELESIVKMRPRVGDKRNSSVAIELSPPQNGFKRRKSETPVSMQKTLTPRKNLGASQEHLSTKKLFVGSWWKQRQEIYDENWMAKQSEGFTKWMNYVLLESTALRLSGCNEQGGAEKPIAGAKRRFDYSSLRVLAQKRMESNWVQSAIELYHLPSINDVLFSLQDEIGNQRLRFRADRPVYADVGLQEDLLNLLNNYHPVWLCLGLYAVLGHQVMTQEKCSLQTIFSCTCAKTTISGMKDSSPDRKMPRALRRIILKHLVNDSHVAQNYRLVKNLMTPLDGSTADRYDGGNAFTNTKKNVNGREYFDSLTQSFMLKFFMLVIFLDRAVEHTGEKFAQFPCLFRIARSTKNTISVKAHDTNEQRNSDELWVKNSKVFVTEFCRLFLASEGRIDKHLKQLGYSLKHEQTALDEINLEIKNLETDLRDGVRLAKLMEALTASASSSTSLTQGSTRKPKGLSTFLRVPALSRLQKVHNVEICLHFLQDKCGASVLDDLKSSSETGEKHRSAGRVRMSSSGFAGLQTKVDAKMMENLAKDIVNGHREKTLALLWKLISYFQLQSLVDAQRMRQEITNVVKRMSFRAQEFFDVQQKKVPLVHTYDHECYGLLLEWCRAVCANYDVVVNDFSQSFADGKALCHLLHYYHPMLLPKSDMLPTTSDRYSGDDQQTSEEALLMNEQRHFAIVNDRIKQLGEVPVLMPQQYNTKNPPEEKMVVTFVCYLQSRLMDSYNEIHAASRLKRWWKSPLIRLRMHRKKNRSARIVQRFWYTSSQKRLAIRQCRKLLRAAHIVKSKVLIWVSRRQFLRLRKAVVTIQAAFRARGQLRMNGHLLGAVQVIQYHWRKHLQRRQQKELQVEQAARRKIAQRVLAKASCGVIERNWLQHLSREGARLVRQQMIADRHVAVSHIQVAWRQGRLRAAARTHRVQMWRREHHAAQVIQVIWGTFHRYREESKRILALQHFEQLMKKEELQKRQMKLKRKVEKRAATCVQRGFRKFVFWKQEIAATKLASAFRGAKQKLQFQMEKRAAVVLQRNVRVWRRKGQLRALTHFHSLLKIYQRMRANEAQRRVIQLQELKCKMEARAARHIQNVYRSFRFQKRTFAATRTQSVVLAWLARKWYSRLCQSVCLLQRNIRIWRRQKQLRALLAFRGLLLRYRRMQQDEKERQEHVRQDRLRRLQGCVEHRAANRIQSLYRSYACHKRMLAATLIQAVFRGLKEKQQYTKKRASVVVMQHSICSWMVVTKFRRALYQHRACVGIQKCVRGWLSRRRFSFYVLQTQLKRMRMLMSCWKIEHWYINRMMKYRKKRMLMIRSRWTQLGAGIVQKRIADANKIAMCWRSFCFKSLIDARIQRRRHMDDAAQRMQVWWLGLCCKWAERQRMEEMKRQCKMEAMALATAKARAGHILALWLYEKAIMPSRERHFHLMAVRKLQAWWRGTFVRLHHSTPEITRQRKKLSAIKLVEQEWYAGSDTSSTSLQQLRVKSNEERNVVSEQPQTLGARLDMALHMLLHGKRLQDMLFASHTIEVCTRYSRECCRKCVQLQISSTIFAAIRGLNRSRPHVELLHQLLLVLRNLTVYRRSADKNNPMRVVANDDANGRLDVDLRALDTLVDLLHIHRDMHHIFVLSADVIAYYLKSLKPLAGRNAGVQESWSEAEKRLGSLQELLSRKLALYNATASFRRVNHIPDKSSANNLMRKMNPKTAVSIMQQLVVLLER
ncbi:unnamed protein product [Peronospora destructor]|uniref:Calponin-homology (CH) domain-containing protein n=2 Tax=Peronospora destructor TaxID=86335 RepID=A0AAV0V7F1_9STRA|nr:unnamed protein product [Peronospora destructor]